MKDISQKDIENNLKLTTSVSGEFRVENKNFSKGENDFLVIAGPCRVESLEQMEEIARSIQDNDLRLIRVGTFKPCTFPYASSGMGEEGLKIIKQVTEKYGLISVSEVMEISQIEPAKNYIDVFQIGARNMQNYNLLAAIGKSGKPVLLKRHPGASLRDLLGAAEWLLHHGCQNLLLCERGVTAPHTHDINARWLLDIQIVPATKRVCRLPLILDVSHSAGVKDFVPHLAGAAAGCGADGLMIEIHPEPDKSQSDKDQIIDLEQFSQLVGKIRKIGSALDKKII
jgi:3-deoxy-7-phosphoheptulonate synthase